MKSFYLVLLTLFSVKLSSQTIDYSFRNENAILKYQLNIDNKNGISQWKLIINAKGDSITSVSKSNVFMVKNDSVSYSDKSIKNRYFILDTEKLVWQESNKSKEILGYYCKSALTNFRGRNYIAYYTTKIKSFFGPWKFRGLGGLILGIESLDGNYAFTAEKLIENKNITLDNYFQMLTTNNTFISWEKYHSIYKNELHQIINSEKCNCPTDGTNILKITKIEKIVPQLHDEGITY